MVVCVGAAAAGATAWVFGTAAGDPSLDQVKPTQQGAVSLVLAADGSRLGYIASDEVRDPVAIGRDPAASEAGDGRDRGPALLRARRRRLRGRSRAPRSQDLEAGKRVEGGSTITQQLVRNLCIPDPERDLERKILEAKLAVELEQHHSKDRSSAST